MRGNASTATEFINRSMRANLEERRAWSIPITSAPFAFTPRIPTSFMSPRSAISGDRTKSAASTAPPMAEDLEASLYQRQRGRRGGSFFDPSQPSRHLRRLSGRSAGSPGGSTAAAPAAALWKSTDGGDTWTDLSHAIGLPEGVLGRIGVTVSPANPERVWALVEAADGGAVPLRRRRRRTGPR